MKKFIILIILLSGLSLTEAQSDQQKGFNEMQTNLDKELDKILSDISKNEFRIQQQSELENQISKMQTDLTMELSKMQTDLVKDLAINEVMINKNLAVNNIHISKDTGLDQATNEVKQFQGDMFERLADIKGVEVVYISKSLLGMMPNMNMPGINIGNVAGKLEGLQIFSAEQKNAVKSLKSESSRLVKGGKYETAMFVKDDDSKTVFYIKKISNKQSEMLMVTEGSNEITVIRFLGNFTMQDIQDLTKNTNVNKR
ncbi:DUF4252 domain-containing protein [Dysgonomonas sp. OttesenSCG-928-M03]|nr:DUF4252 domain-containing protein [Dysgonomonas sp. OttesenSCG-928-M03]